KRIPIRQRREHSDRSAGKNSAQAIGGHHADRDRTVELYRIVDGRFAQQVDGGNAGPPPQPSSRLRPGLVLQDRRVEEKIDEPVREQRHPETSGDRPRYRLSLSPRYRLPLQPQDPLPLQPRALLPRQPRALPPTDENPWQHRQHGYPGHHPRPAGEPGNDGEEQEQERKQEADDVLYDADKAPFPCPPD